MNTLPYYQHTSGLIQWARGDGYAWFFFEDPQRLGSATDPTP